VVTVSVEVAAATLREEAPELVECAESPE